MSTIKITQLPVLAVLNSNTSNTLFVGVDVPSDTTGKFTATTLAQGLFSNNALVVGSNPILLTNTVAQFSGTDSNYIQFNLQNYSNTGAGDMVITADVGTDTGGFIDLGINNSQWNPVVYGQTSQFPLDGYLVVDGPVANATGNLVIGTANPGTNVVFAVGGQYANNISAKITANGLVLNTQSYITFSDGTVQLTAVSNTFVSANDAATLQAAKNFANSVVSFQSGTLSNTINVVYNQANAAFAEANAAFAAGNTTSGTLTVVSGVANIALYNSTSGWNLANTASSNTVVTQGVDATQNTSITAAFIQANSAYNQANSATANAAAASSYANSAFSYANTSLQNTATITTNSALIVTGALYAANTIRTPLVFPGSQTAITVSFSNSSMLKCNVAAALTVSLANYVPGKFVDLLIVNTSATPQTITHGLAATNSTINATTFSMAGTSTAYLRYFSIASDIGNTFVAVQHA